MSGHGPTCDVRGGLDEALRVHSRKSLPVMLASVVLVSRICMSAASVPPVLTSTITSAPATSLMRT